jgi:hypothetical protein
LVSQRTSRRRQRRRDKERGFVNSSSQIGFGQVTVPGNYPFAGFQSDELIRISEVKPQEIQMMLDMDGHARALFNIFRRPILKQARVARVLPRKKNGSDGEKEAEFCHDMLTDPRSLGGMKTPFVKTVAQQTMAAVFGNRVFEKIWDPPGSVVDDEFVRINRLMALSNSGVTFLVEDNGTFKGIRFRATWKNETIDKTLTPERVAYISIDDEETPYYGKSLFLPAYYHFDKKHKLYYILHLALSVGALPPRIARSKMSMNDDTKKTFLNALGQLGANAAIMMPDGITLPKDEQLTGAATALPYVEAINHHNMEMSKSVLMQFVDIGTGDSGGGGFSLSKNHLDFAMMGLEHLMGEVTDMWNQQVFPELIWWNFKSKNVPILEFPTLESDTREAILEIFSKILTARETPVSPEFIAEMEKKVALEFGFELDDEEVMENQKRRIAQEELEQAMEQANRDIGAAVSKMETADILKDSGLMNYMSGWWESTSRKISDRIVSEVG